MSTPNRLLLFFSNKRLSWIIELNATEDMMSCVSFEKSMPSIHRNGVNSEWSYQNLNKQRNKNKMWTFTFIFVRRK